MTDAQLMYHIRKALHLTQSEMATELGYSSYDMITKIETGRRQLSGPAKKLLKRIAKDNDIGT